MSKFSMGLVAKQTPILRRLTWHHCRIDLLWPGFVLVCHPCVMTIILLTFFSILFFIWADLWSRGLIDWVSELWVLIQPLSLLLLNNHWTFSVELDVPTLFIHGKNRFIIYVEYWMMSSLDLSTKYRMFLSVSLLMSHSDSLYPLSYSPIMVTFLGCQKKWHWNISLV